MNLRAVAVAVSAATGVLLTAGVATAQTAARPGGLPTGQPAGAERDQGVALIHKDRLTPSSVVDYALEVTEG
ncbi:hypothetical protein [Streptomyces sp. NPDC006368]|uniref:hypothetical protein n=1 Tax=Streptomyces sp. NPDC006368 TaxID=3156760 RepID=UPI00339E3CAD